MNSNGKSAPQACVTMPWYECRDGIFEIDEFDCASAFVIVGEERALLVDTGVGIGDLKWLVENRITDKPFEVIATHNHGDHIGGAGWFDQIWIHPADLDWNSGDTRPTLDFRKSYARLIQNRENKYYSYDADTDIREWPKDPSFRALSDGQTFDLGGRIITVHHCPGHTRGEIVLTDSKTKTLLCGDACNCNWLLNTDMAPSGRECIKISLDALERIKAMEGKRYDADSVFNFHHDFRGFGQELSPDALPNLIACLRSLLDGTAEFCQVPDALAEDGSNKTVAVYGNVQVSCMQGSIAEIL